MNLSTAEYNIIKKYEDLGIVLWVENEGLCFKAPNGVVTESIKKDLLQDKVHILRYFSEINEDKFVKWYDNKKCYPLSYAQKRLWYLTQIQEGVGNYNIVNSFILNGQLNIEILRKSISKIVQRHGSLRTNFVQIDEEPFQFIKEELTFYFQFEDLTINNSSLSIESVIDESINEEFNYKFILESDSLLRVKVLKIESEIFILIINTFHIISDGWSSKVFLEELEFLYRSYLTNTNFGLEEITYQYVDYCIDSIRQENKLISQQEFWLSKFKGELPLLTLPYDFNRSQTYSSTGSYEQLEISGDLLQKLYILSSNTSSSLFMIFLAAFKVILYRHTNEPDLIVGFPIANRNRKEYEPLIGFFINTLAVRTKMSKELTFSVLLEQIKDFMLNAYENQDYPFEKLVEELRPERRLNVTPIFQVWFNMVNIEDEKLLLDGIEAEPYQVKNIPTKFDISCYVQKRSNDHVINLIYNNNVYSNVRIVELLEQYKKILIQIADNPYDKITDYSLLTNKSANILPDPSKEFQIADELLIIDQIDDCGALYPDRKALVDVVKHWSYLEVINYSNKIANWLSENECKERDVVAIIAERNSLLIISVLGIMKTGGVFVIIDSDYPNLYIEERLKITKASFVINLSLKEQTHWVIDYFVQGTVKGLNLNYNNCESILSTYANYFTSLNISLDNPSYITFTSGSTGIPKAILSSNRPISHFIRWYLQRFEYTNNENFAMLSGLSHDPLLRDIFTPLCIGATLYIPEGEFIKSNKLINWIFDNNISVMHITPGLAKLLVDSCNEGYNSFVKYVLFGGDIVTKDMIGDFRKSFPNAKLFNCYGTSETPQVISLFEIQTETLENYSHKIPIGKGIDGVQILILSSSLRLAGIGEIGEIFVQTPYLSLGYLNDEYKTKEVYIEDSFSNDKRVRLYKTGDIGRYLLDGTIDYIGRADNQLKIRGFRVDPKEIEMSIINAIDDIIDCIVIAVENDKREPLLVAFYVSEVEVSSLFIKKLLKRVLPEYMIPSQFIKIDSIPLNNNGKPDIKNLKDKIFLNHLNEQKLIPPTTEMEKLISTIWKDILGVENVSISDNFFDIGGYSLAVIRVITKIRVEINIQLSFREFVNSDLQGIAKQCENMIVKTGTAVKII